MHTTQVEPGFDDVRSNCPCAERHCFQISLLQISFAQISGEICDGARVHRGVSAGVQRLAHLPVACWSLELAEKINNYLNTREIDKSSEPNPHRPLRIGLMRPSARKDAEARRKLH
jgi:hypothetical protein